MSKHLRARACKDIGLISITRVACILLLTLWRRSLMRVSSLISNLIVKR